MSNKRYTEEFKIEAVKQVTERCYSVQDVAHRLGTTTHSLYTWRKQYSPRNGLLNEQPDSQSEIARLKAELKRVTEERDPKKGHRVLRQTVPVKYAFIHSNRTIFNLLTTELQPVLETV